MESDNKRILPTLESVKQGIEYLNSGVLRPYKKGENIREYEKFADNQIINSLTIFPGGVLHLNGLNNIPFKFFRARPWDEIIRDELRSEYSYPPISYTTTKRANLDGHPVFYCAFDPLTAVMEVIQNREKFEENKDRLYCISSWKIKDYRNIKLSSFMGDLDVGHPFYDFKQFQQNEFKKQLGEEKRNIEQAEIISEIYNFLSNSFLESEDYVISSYFSHKHLYARHSYRTDILIYPSIVIDKRTTNFAINPNFVDERMYLKCVYVLKINAIDYDDGKVSEVKMLPVKIGINKESIIYWREFSKDDIEVRKLVEEDFPTVKAFDE